MAKHLGRPRLTVRKVEWTVCLSTPLAETVELLLYDPRYSRARRGSKSELIEGLLQAWVNGFSAQPDDSPPAVSASILPPQPPESET